MVATCDLDSRVVALICYDCLWSIRSDCLIERDFLFSHVIPPLRRFSQTLGIQFHAVDLFSFIPRSATSESKDSEGSCQVDSNLALYDLEREGALSLISKEIELCQKVSPGLNFVVSWSW